MDNCFCKAKCRQFVCCHKWIVYSRITLLEFYIWQCDTVVIFPFIWGWNYHNNIIMIVTSYKYHGHFYSTLCSIIWSVPVLIDTQYSANQATVGHPQLCIIIFVYSWLSNLVICWWLEVYVVTNSIHCTHKQTGRASHWVARKNLTLYKMLTNKLQVWWFYVTLFLACWN